MSEPASYVYFVQSGAGNIKIGVSNNPGRRLFELRSNTDSALNLLLAIPGDCKTETALHKELKSYHSHGEWFFPCPQVFAVIERERAACGNITIFPSTSKRKKKDPKNALQAWRFKRGLTGEQAAKLFDIQRTHISHLENGIRMPSWPVLERIFAATNGEITPNDFAHWLRPAKAEVA